MRGTIGLRWELNDEKELAGGVNRVLLEEDELLTLLDILVLGG